MSLPTAFDPDMPTRAPSTSSAIRLQDISVQYRVPHEPLSTLKEHAIRLLQRRLRYDNFLALRRVDLEVQRGESVGIIGHNGAGKSTLLKVISRVLRPTQGHVRIRGRVAPLLEFSAALHPELTGRENVYLNGALFGFSHGEMRRRFSQIIDFAELWDFVDAPLRTYSSGMVARLGFAVATDTPPDILIVDEVFSVGDAAFQRKSLERLQSFRGLDTTILLVTHNLDLLPSMCDRAIWIDHGSIIADGSADAIVRQYRSRTDNVEAARLSREAGPSESQRWGNRRIEIVRVRLMNARLEEQNVFETGDPLILRIDYQAHSPVPAPIFGVGIHRQDGLHITGPNTKFACFDLPALEGAGTVTYAIPALPMLEGLFHISVAVHSHNEMEMYDYHDRAYPFRIINTSGRMKERYGVLSLGGTWQHHSD